MSRYRRLSYAIATLLTASLLSAQDGLDAQQGQPPERIDLLGSPDGIEGPLEDCSEAQEAAAISGEIVVCRRRRDQSDLRYSDDKAAERRYAEETMDKGNPRAPDFIASCQDQGWPAGCFRVGRVPPPALIIDVEALPEAPPGSDADRVARGLAPRGNDTGTRPPAAVQQNDLDLPPPRSDDEVSPSGSASPEEGPSD